MCVKNLMRFNLSATIMHSSRMLTVRCSRRLLVGGGVCAGRCLPRGVFTRAVSAPWKGACPGEVSARGGGGMETGCHLRKHYLAATLRCGR